LGYDELPETMPDDALDNLEFLKRVHHALNNVCFACIKSNILQLEVEEGVLICSESGREFPIKNGIPDMLLKENEVK
jgi:multifunctional methyltransferase subunit TRM112